MTNVVIGVDPHKLSVRARLDPYGHFQNEYARRVLGPVGTPVAALRRAAIVATA